MQVAAVLAYETNREVYMIKLEEVNKCNYEYCIYLELEPSQKGNLTPNSISIAQSKFETRFRTRAICKDDEVIGFLAYCHEDEPEDLEHYWLFRFMFDKAHQGKGYASEALQLLIDEVRALGGKRLQTMHKPRNVNAGSAYKKFGFREIGVLDDGDIHLEISVR